MKSNFVQLWPMGMDGYTIDLRRPSNPIYPHLCEGCRRVLPNLRSPDVEVNEPRLLRTSLTSVWGIGLGIFRQSVLDALDPDAVKRDLVMGRVFTESGRKFEGLHSFVGRQSVVVRHAANGRYRRCATCMFVFYAGDFRKKSLISGQANEGVIYANGGAIVCSVDLVNIDRLKGLPGCRVLSLEEIEHATDGLPDVLN